MHWINTIAICMIATIALFPGYVLSSCCFSISAQPLQPSSTYYKADNNAPPSYAITLSATSQFAVNNPGGPVYLALITFPGNYVLSAIPNGCVSVSINTVNCTVSAMNTLVADFASVIVADGTQPTLESVVVNGEVCTTESSCPTYTPTNPGSTATWSVTPVPPATTSNPPSNRPSRSTSSSSQSSQSSHVSSSFYPSSSSASPPSPTSDPSDTPASEVMGFHNSKIGLIVGLTLAFALLIFLASLYFLCRRRQSPQTKPNTGGSRVSGRWGGAAAAAALFRIRLKGSKLSLGRTSLHGSPYMAATSEKVVSNNEDPFFQANAALAQSTSTISVTTASEKSTTAMGTGTGFGMTLIDIPEAYEPEDSPSFSSSSSEVNYFQNENDELERNLDAEFAEATITTTTELVDKDNNNDNQQAPSSSSTSRYPWFARAANKSSQLHRAVSAASNRLLPLHSTDASRRSSIEQQEQRLSRTQTGRYIIPGPRFPKDGLSIKNNSNSDCLPTRSASYSMSLPRPPKSIHRASTRDTSSHGQVFATIRPEHHQQLIHQQRLDQGLTPDQPLPSYTYRQLASGATPAGTAANAAALSAALAQSGSSGLFRSRSDSAGSAVDSFVNPGPPPHPPTRRTSRNWKASGSGNGSGSRKGYNQPIHIRPPGPSFQPNQQQAQAGSEGGSGLYGYM
ncbi:hypothetical protein EC957_002217 [Mortierella hygrophila]|uniref:Mid2 domain-containing protein n=1 Tax=Mortierella hygrophila TaxID=979708 RepID=A0A9P6K237_9FUNG|nr:hypothetical protein EC957_002217 [Mortierella hygrophila]